MSGTDEEAPDSDTLNADAPDSDAPDSNAPDFDTPDSDAPDLDAVQEGAGSHLPSKASLPPVEAEAPVPTDAARDDSVPVGDNAVVVEAKSRAEFGTQSVTFVSDNDVATTAESELLITEEEVTEGSLDDDEGELETIDGEEMEELEEEEREEGDEEEELDEEECYPVDWGPPSESVDESIDDELECEEQEEEGESVADKSEDSYNIPPLVPDLFYQMNPQYIDGDILDLRRAEVEAEEDEFGEEGDEAEESLDAKVPVERIAAAIAPGKEEGQKMKTEPVKAEEEDEESEQGEEEGEESDGEEGAEEDGEEEEYEKIEETTDFDETEIESDLLGEGEKEGEEGSVGEGQEFLEREGEEEQTIVSGEPSSTELPRNSSSPPNSPSQSDKSAEVEESIDSQENLQRLLERNALEQQYRALALQKHQLNTRNQMLQQRLSDHFSRRTDDIEHEKNVGELETRYIKYMNTIRDQQRTIDDEKARQLQELQEFRMRVDEETELVAAQYAEVVELRRQMALKSRSTRTGQLMPAAEVDALISRETTKEVDVATIRLESLRRESKMLLLEKAIKESEELAGGIHLIDFEQLKIENQTFAEKIEERNEDLSKLRRKISNTVQVMTHLKERIQFEQRENEQREQRLLEVSEEVTRGRESLAVLKQRRDRVRHHTTRKRADAGLLGHEALLRDFEQRVDEEAHLKRTLAKLKHDYALNKLMAQQIREEDKARERRMQRRNTVHVKPF